MPNIDDIEIEDYSLTGCYIRSNVITSFIGVDADSDEPQPTTIFFYYLDEPIDDRWSSMELPEAYGLFGCECHEPDERWVWINKVGDAMVTGGGIISNETIPVPIRSLLQQACCIANGKAYVVGSLRQVWRRDAKSQWTDMSVPFNKSELDRNIDSGFDCIDGFSDDDIYAAGESGDAWRYDGEKWHRLDLPTNDDITDIACGEDGQVYMIGWKGTIIKGRDNNWKLIKQDSAEDFQSAAWFNDRLYIANWTTLFQLKDDEFTQVPDSNGYSQGFCGFLAAGHGHLISAGPKEALIFDGKNWEVLFNFN